jgi:hypothetical protein
MESSDAAAASPEIFSFCSFVFWQAKKITNNNPGTDF